MTAFLIAAVVVVVVIAGMLYLRRQTVENRAGAIDFRTMALTGPPPHPGISPRPGEAWQVVMETTFPNGSATLAALSDGTASVFFSRGGVINGGDDADVVAAAKNFVREANKHAGRLKAASDLSAPAFGAVRFFVRTGDSNLAYEGAEADLAGGRDPVSSLYSAGQKLMEQLRLLSID